MGEAISFRMIILHKIHAHLPWNDNFAEKLGGHPPSAHLSYRPGRFSLEHRDSKFVGQNRGFMGARKSGS